MNTKSKLTTDSLRAIEKIVGGKLTLGKLLWAIRKSDETSQIAFAEKLGISKQHLCDLEHDRKTVSPKLAAAYAKILGYSPEQFIRLALQNIIDKEGLKVIVKIEPMFNCAHQLRSKIEKGKD